MLLCPTFMAPHLCRVYRGDSILTGAPTLQECDDEVITHALMMIPFPSPFPEPSIRLQHTDADRRKW